jgi:streptogrisin C
MRPRRILLSVVIVASLGALSAITIPALAGTNRPGSSPSAEPVPELLAAMRRDLGLTERQAVDRVSTEAWASRTVAGLRAELSERQWGGAWLRDGETLLVAVTDQQAADEVRAAGAEPRLVDHSQRDLETVMSTLDGNAGQAGQVTGWYVDVAENAVTLVAPAEAQAWAFAAASGMTDSAVRVEASDEQPRPLFDVIGGDAYFINNAFRCSVGFSVVGGFVTAGHCGEPGDSTAGFNGEAQGEFVASSFPTTGQRGPDDWGVVAVNQEWVPQPAVNDFAGSTLPVAGSDEAPVGASVCKSGSTTGVTCGVIEAKNATVNYPEGTVTGLTRTDVCAEPGDSGGSWLSGDQAQGVTSGGSGDCTFGGTTFFQPVNEILEVNNLTLVTTG